jgi:hypothetical protein
MAYEELVICLPKGRHRLINDGAQSYGQPKVA